MKEQFIQNLLAAGGEIAQEITPDFYMVDGVFGVAENGAIWVEEYTKELFLSENLAIRVQKIVPTMIEAMELVQASGVFIAGPSKTADVESFLVYGAHGPKRLVVQLL